VDRNEVIEILLTYRRGVDDAEPRVREALERAAADPELAAFIEQEQRRNAAIRARLRDAAPPEDLLQKILLQQPEFPHSGWSARHVWQLAAALVVLCGISAYWFWPTPKNSFVRYEQYLGGMVSRPYRMSLETNNLDRIRTFLANNQAPADYVLSGKLQQTDALGCATLSWNGNPVSMLCFADQAKRKVFLFVVSREAIPDAPAEAAKRFQRVGQFAVTGWTEGGRSYVLAVEGDEHVLDKYL